MVSKVVSQVFAGLLLRARYHGAQRLSGPKGAFHTSNAYEELHEWVPSAALALWPCMPCDRRHFVGLPGRFRSCTDSLGGARGDDGSNPSSGPDPSGYGNSNPSGGVKPNPSGHRSSYPRADSGSYAGHSRRNTKSYPCGFYANANLA